MEHGTDISGCIRREKSSLGRGGMTAKCNIARKVADEGIRVIIANGRRDGILTSLVTKPQDTPHTEFVPASKPASNVRKWIAHSVSFTKGTIRVNDKAAEALRSDKAASLLPVGVTAVEGDFGEGDLIDIVDGNGRKIAVGRSAYGSEEARACAGKHGIRPLVRYEYMYME